MKLRSIFKKPLSTRLTNLAVEFGKQKHYTMFNFTTDTNVEVMIEKTTPQKELINEMLREYKMQLEWLLDEKGIKDLTHIGVDSYGNVIYESKNSTKDVQHTLEFEPDVWVHNHIEDDN